MTTNLEVPVEGGFRLCVDTTEGIGRVLVISGIWEPQVTALFQRILSAGDVCVDIGANAGYFTLLASRLVGPRGHIYAFEPAPKNYAQLTANLKLNEVSNVTALNVAAGAAEADGLLEDRSPGQAMRSMIRHGSVDVGSPSATAVPVRPVASVLESADRGRLRLVKVDVEGYEAEVLRGLEPVFEAGARPDVIVEVHAGRVDDAALVVAALCERYALKAYRLVEDDALERAAPRLRPVKISPPELPSEDHHLLLTA
jgi:FkbM family methyltransferase